jgi:predicted secreted hydrolase
VLRGTLGGAASDVGFARALAIRPFVFPQDHGPHPQYRDEWWYVTGHLSAPKGVRFGFELTFFRIGLEPRAATSEQASQSHWRTKQIYVAHFAITDIERGQFHSTQRFARDALGLAGAQAAPFRVWLGGWSLGDAGAAGVWTLRAADAAYGLTLELRALDPPVLNGDRGLSIKSDAPGSANYYYSIPRLEARGQLVRAGQALPVNGTVWLDREWGSSSLGPHEQGWDWFGIQFTDGSALMFYNLRDEGGTRDRHSAGTWIAPDGSGRPLAGDEVSIEIEGHWKSPRGGVYPSRWRVRVSSLALDVQATPVLADQELDTAPRYWEGDVDVSGTKDGRAIAGQGYVELVGYGGG